MYDDEIRRTFWFYTIFVALAAIGIWELIQFLIEHIQIIWRQIKVNDFDPNVFIAIAIIFSATALAIAFKDGNWMWLLLLLLFIDWDSNA